MSVPKKFDDFATTLRKIAEHNNNIANIAEHLGKSEMSFAEMKIDVVDMQELCMALAEGLDIDLSGNTDPLLDFTPSGLHAYCLKLEDEDGRIKELQRRRDEAEAEEDD